MNNKTRNSNHEKALAKFTEYKAKIDEHLRALQQFSDNHFDVDPDQVTYANVGDLASIEETLKEITDRVFQRGEYASAGFVVECRQRGRKTGRVFTSLLENDGVTVYFSSREEAEAEANRMRNRVKTDEEFYTYTYTVRPA